MGDPTVQTPNTFQATPRSGTGEVALNGPLVLTTQCVQVWAAGLFCIICGFLAKCLGPIRYRPPEEA